jgi:hypothetical protein
VLHDLHVYPRRERQRRGTVAQIMQPDRRQPGLTSQLLEPGGDIGGVQRAAVGLGEQQVGLDPVTAEPGTGRVLWGSRSLSPALTSSSTPPFHTR